jgi:hypothetical protein
LKATAVSRSILYNGICFNLWRRDIEREGAAEGTGFERNGKRRREGERGREGQGGEGKRAERGGKGVGEGKGSEHHSSDSLTPCNGFKEGVEIELPHKTSKEGRMHEQ